MRTLLEVNNEIISLTEDLRTDETLTKSQISRKKNRIIFLRLIQKYLEECPSELYLTREIKRIENRINAIINSFNRSLYADLKEAKEAQKEYEKEMGIPHLRLQLRTLRYIKK